MRKIPSVMATQHPDNALAPYWDLKGSGFINALQETKECVECFSELSVDEYMWDWEGKHADASVVDKLLSEHLDFFTKKQLAKDIFLTFRIPNIWNEKGYTLIQAMTAVLIAEDFARDLKFKNRPLFEVILPMTERAEQLMKMHKLFQSLAQFKSKTFNGGKNVEHLELIPLIEGVENQLGTYKLLSEYVELHKKHFKKSPSYLRLFLARSDPAMASGMLATVLANKIALHQANEFSNKYKIPIYPIAGVGGLVFRGGLTPGSVKEFIKSNPGFSTVTLQSSFRYDHPKNEVKKSIEALEKHLPKAKIKKLDEKEIEALERIIKISETNYQSTLQKIAKDLDVIFRAVPRRRERRLHIGLLAYQRSIGKQTLPRAISFTCGFYSLGVPPEFIGFGRSLAELGEKDREVLMKNYPSLKDDLLRAGCYLNKENLRELSANNPDWMEVAEDVELIERILKIKLGPKTYEQHAHKNLASSVLMAKNNQAVLPDLITEMAHLRKSLG